MIFGLRSHINAMELVSFGRFGNLLLSAGCLNPKISLSEFGLIYFVFFSS